MATLNGFDKLAAVYDDLASFVYGKSIKNSQRHFLHHIPTKAKVLILGGGTGWLLKEIMLLRPACEIWYIEASEKMIALSKSKIVKENIHFIHGTENDIPPISFDIVITNFYLDLFAQQSIDKVIGKIKSSLETKSSWLVTDFLDQGKLWQKIMLRMMYSFFHYVSQIESKSLQDWNSALQENGMTKKEAKSFYNGFIESCVYNKSN